MYSDRTRPRSPRNDTASGSPGLYPLRSARWTVGSGRARCLAFRGGFPTAPEAIDRIGAA